MENATAKELKTFSALAADWWNPAGSMRMLHKMNPIRLQYIKSQIMLTEKKILDVGCGGGILTESMTQSCAEVTGIDLSAPLIQAAREHAQKKRLMITYQCISIEKLAQDFAEHFDIITCLELLEHVPDPQKLVQDCAKCLAPGGIIFFSTITRSIKSYLYGILAAEYVLNLLPKGTHSYAQFILPSELNGFAEAAGLLLQDITGITFHPFKKTFSLSQNISVNYITCYKKIG